MSTVKISQLPEASALSGDELVPAVQSGQTVGASVAQIRAGLLASSHDGSGGPAHAHAVAGGQDGFMSGADKAKLDAIQASATANSTDAQLRDRGTHTGTQPHTSISGLGSMATQAASDFVTLTGTETLTNKTMIAPTVIGPIITGTGSAEFSTVTTTDALKVGGWAAFTSNNSGQCPPYNFGLSIGANYTAGYGETDFWNCYQHAAFHSFVFKQMTSGTTANTLIAVNVDGSVTPGIDNAQTLGSASYRWSEVFAGTGIINTSDARDKEMINPVDPVLTATLVRAIDPVTFKWRDIDRPTVVERRRIQRQKTEPVTVVRHVVERVGDIFIRRRVEEVTEQPVFAEHPLHDQAGQPLLDDQGEPILHREPVLEEVDEEVIVSAPYRKANLRTHWGFLAQQVEQGLCTALGSDPTDPVQRAEARLRFAGLIYDGEADRYGLREGQFIPILWATLRALLNRVETLEAVSLQA